MNILAEQPETALMTTADHFSNSIRLTHGWQEQTVPWCVTEECVPEASPVDLQRQMRQLHPARQLLGD